MALVAPGEPADLRPPPRPGAVARSVSPWQLMDAPTLRPSTPYEGQGISTNRQSVGEALQELQSRFKDFSEQEKEARSVQEGELQKLRSDLGEEKATTECVAADVRALQDENTVLRGQLQQVAADVQGLRSALQAALAEKEARSVQEEELRKLRLDLSNEKAKTDRVEADVLALQSENAVLREQLQQGKEAANQAAALQEELQQQVHRVQRQAEEERAQARHKLEDADRQAAGLKEELRRVHEQLGEERAEAQRVVADVQSLRSALQAALDEAGAARSQDRTQLEEEKARTQQMAADVQSLRSALQAALDEAGAARSQDRTQLEEERARTQQRQTSATVRLPLPPCAADVQSFRSALQAAMDEAGAAWSQDRTQLEEERARTQQTRCQHPAQLEEKRARTQQSMMCSMLWR